MPNFFFSIWSHPTFCGAAPMPPQGKKALPLRTVLLIACQKSLAEFAAAAANKMKSFSAAACTWAKILLRLQVCELFTTGEQGVRAADCILLSKSSVGVYCEIQVAVSQSAKKAPHQRNYHTFLGKFSLQCDVIS